MVKKFQFNFMSGEPSYRMNLFVLQMVNFAANSGYAILIPLFPPLAKEKGIDESIIGIIFCLYPVGGFIVSMILGQTMTVNIMKKIMLLGLIMTMTGMSGMGLMAYVENNLLFILLSGFLRFITGVGATCCFTPSYGMATYLFPNRITQVISQMQIISGLALFSGPFLGSAFYVVGEKTFFGGFSMPMYVLSLIYLCTIPLLLKGLQDNPKPEQFSILISDPESALQIDQRVSQIGNSQQRASQQRISQPDMRQSQQPNRNSKGISQFFRASKDDNRSILSVVIDKLTYYHVFSISAVSLLYLTHILIFTTQIGARTYLSVYLKEEYGLSDSQSTLVFLVNTIVGSVVVFGAGRVKNLPKRPVICAGITFYVLSFFLYGPDTLFTGLPHQLFLVCIADGLFGMGNGFYNLCLISEYADCLRKRYPYLKDEVNGMASALYISGWTVGEFAGPLIGGFMTQNMAYYRVCSIFGFTLLFFEILYISFCLYDRKKSDKIEDAKIPLV